MNEKLIFQHLPKCGGSTFNKIIYRMYKPHQTFSIHTVDNVRLNTDEFINLPVEKRNQINLIYGHMKFGLHNYMSGDPKYITFLRKPEERIVSYYYYVLSLPQHRLHKKVVDSNMTLYDFVTTIKEWDINNGQIMFISGIEDKEEFMLEKALENIERDFSFVGTVEKFQQSLIILKKMYDWPMPYYKIINKTEHRPLIKNINKKTLEVIGEFNKGDNVLYEKMNEKLELLINNHRFLNLELYRLSLYNKLYSINQLKNLGGKLKQVFNH